MTSPYNRPMFRRVLLILMMCALPFQMAWSAASVYCEHETGKAAQHFGHHDHVHTGGSLDPDLKGKLDPDCSYHSLTGFYAFPASNLLAFDSPTSGIQNAAHPPFHPLSVFQRLDRPKWAAA